MHATRHALISRSHVLLQTYACLPPYTCPLLLCPPQRLLPGEAIPAGAAKPRCARLFSTLAVSMAVTAASYPLLPALPPALSMACRATARIEAQHLMPSCQPTCNSFSSTCCWVASRCGCRTTQHATPHAVMSSVHAEIGICTCSMVSVVMTQKMTGMPASKPALRTPLVAALTTASKCAVAPLTCRRKLRLCLQQGWGRFFACTHAVRLLELCHCQCLMCRCKMGSTKLLPDFSSRGVWKVLSNVNSTGHEGGSGGVGHPKRCTCILAAFACMSHAAANPCLLKASRPLVQ